MAEADKGSEAAADCDEVEEKKAVKKQLLKDVKTVNSTVESRSKIEDNSSTLPGSANAAQIDSRDVTPTTVRGNYAQTAPTITSGVTSTTTGPGTPVMDTTTALITPENVAARGFQGWYTKQQQGRTSELHSESLESGLCKKPNQ